MSAYKFAGATVVVECKDNAGKRLFYNEDNTDKNGLFSIAVKGEHEHDACEAYTLDNPKHATFEQTTTALQST